MREAAARPDNELLRDKVQIKGEDILTENKKGRKEKNRRQKSEVATTIQQKRRKAYPRSHLVGVM